MSDHNVVSSDKAVVESQCCPLDKFKPIVDHDQYLSSEAGAEDDDTVAMSPVFNTDGLRVLAVDDNIVCLRILVAALHQCKYNVTETSNPVEALHILRKRKREFDIVITDLRMLEMEGLVLLQKISLEMDIPVVMLSADDRQENIMKAIRYGARDYIIKPPGMAQIKNVWQHVVRKRLFGSPKNANNNNNNNASSVTVEGEKSPPKRKLLEIEGTSGMEDDEAVSKKKRRVTWTAELHNKFMDAIQKIGRHAVPMEILREMNVPWLTRSNVASHLQKFKNAITKQNDSLDTAEGGQQSHLSSMTQGMKRIPYQQSTNSRMVPLGTNQHLLLNHKVQHYKPTMNPSAPTMLNNAPLRPYPPVPRLNGLILPSLGNNMTNCSYSSCQTVSGNMPIAAPSVVNAGQGYAGSMQNNMYQQLDWTGASGINTSNFDTDSFQTNMKAETNHFNGSAAHEELPIDANSFQPISTNLSDEELNSMVNLFNFEGPPCL